MAPWREIGPIGGFDGEGFLGQVIAVEQDGELRAFVSLDDLERWMAEDSSKLPEALRACRLVYDSWEIKTGGIYVNETTLK